MLLDSVIVGTPEIAKIYEVSICIYQPHCPYRSALMPEVNLMDELVLVDFNRLEFLRKAHFTFNHRRLMPIREDEL